MAGARLEVVCKANSDQCQKAINFCVFRHFLSLKFVCCLVKEGMGMGEVEVMMVVGMATVLCWLHCQYDETSKT